MFELFNEAARRTIALAHKEVLRLGHDDIGTVHILLALLRAGGVAPFVFAALGHDVESVRAEIERRVGRGRSSASPGGVPFTPPAKKTLDGAMLEAQRLGHSFIGPEHLLLGMLREETGGPVRAIVESLGPTAADLRQRVCDILADERTYAEAKRFPGTPPHLQ